MSLDEPEPVDRVLTFLSGYDTLEYSWVKATAVSVRLQILFVTLLSDCLSGKSTRGMPGGRFVGEGGFRSQEPDGCEMTLGFRQVRAARDRNTLRPVLCVLYELDDERCRWDEMRSMGPLTVPL